MQSRSLVEPKGRRVMDWDRVNVWTNTLYTMIHSLQLARAVQFGELSDLHASIVSAEDWIAPECSFKSPLAEVPFGNGKARFRRDPNKHFKDIAKQLVKMLVQDLTVIFDEMMAESIAEHGFAAQDYPQAKIEKLATKLDKDRFDWARKGCLELIAVRNVLTHGNGRWNEKSIVIVKDILDPVPKSGQSLSVGVPMLFRYRKAIRTFLNETRVRTEQRQVASLNGARRPMPKGR